MTLLIAAVALVLAYTVQSAFGFGSAILSIPILTLVLPITQITPLIAMLTMTLSAGIVWNTWRAVDTSILWRLLLTASFGVPLGIGFLVFVDEAIVKMTLGAVVVAVSANVLFGIKPPGVMPDTAVWPFGLVIGILGGAYSLLGIPLIMFLQWAKLDAKTLRATIHAFSLALTIVIIACYGGGGLLSKATLTNYAAALIPMILGGVLGGILVKKVREEQFQHIIYGLLMVMGFSLLFSGYQAL